MANIHSINIGGSTYVIEPKTVKINDVRGADRATSYFADYSLTPWFNQNSGFDGSNWASGITMKGWTNDYQSWQLAAGSTSSLKSGLKFRNGINDTWQPWKSVILEGDAATSASSIYVTYNPSSNNKYSVPFMDYGHTQNSKIYSDNTFNYNPYTNTLTATKFAGTATKAFYAEQTAIHTLEFIKDSGLCSLNDIYEVPVILGGCDCAMFWDQPYKDYFGLMTDYHHQNNNSNWLRYNFNDQTLKSTNFEGNLNGTATKVNVTNKTFGMSYLAFFDDKTSGGSYAYSYSHAFMNFFTGEMQIPNLRLRHTNKNYGSYLWFGYGNYSYIFENPDDKLNIYSNKGAYILGGPTYLSSIYTYVSKPMYFYSNILPVNDSYSDIGSSDKRFSTIYADNFNGTLDGTAENATYINVASSSTNASYYLTFVNDTSSNRRAYTDSLLNFNPNTNSLSVPTTYIDNAYIQNIKTKNHVSINVPNTAYSTLNNIWSKPFFMTYCSGQWAEHNYRFRVYDTQNPISIAGEFVFNVRRTTKSTYAYLVGDLYWETLNNPAAARSIIAFQGPPVSVTYNGSGGEIFSNYTSGNVTLYFNWPKGSDVWLTPNIELISERTAVSENSYYKMLTTYSWTGNGVLKTVDNKSSSINKSFKITSNAKDILNTADTNTFVQSVRVLTESQYSSISKDPNTLYLVLG